MDNRTALMCYIYKIFLAYRNKLFYCIFQHFKHILMIFSEYFAYYMIHGETKVLRAFLIFHSVRTKCGVHS